MYDLHRDGGIAKDLAEERQRELLEEAEARRLAEEAAHGDEDADNNEVQPEAYQPVTDSKDKLVKTRRTNRHIHRD